MAKLASIIKQEILASTIKQDAEVQSVQELVKRGDEVPEYYIFKEGVPQAVEAPPELWMDTLLVDFSLLASTTPAAGGELAKFRSALTEWRCFHAINHGIESSFLEDIIEICKQFFALPLEEKLKCAQNDDRMEGYSSDTQYQSWGDRIQLTVHPEENKMLEFWPKKPEKFRELMEEYTKHMIIMKEVIYKAMSRSLNLEEDCFLKHEGKQGVSYLRVTMYPPCPRSEQVYGVYPHEDLLTLTIILPQPDIGGLEIQNDGCWYKVPIIPGALFVALGIEGEAMTNGMLKSLTHRVITNSERERVSVTALFTSGDEIEVGPVSELITEHRPQLYKRLNTKDLPELYIEALSKGLKPIDALRA